MQTVSHSTRIKQSLLLSAGHFTTCRHLHLWQFWEPKWLCLNPYLSLGYFRCWPFSKITFEILMQWFLAHSDKQQGRAYFPIAGFVQKSYWAGKHQQLEAMGKNRGRKGLVRVLGPFPAQGKQCSHGTPGRRLCSLLQPRSGGCPAPSPGNRR